MPNRRQFLTNVAGATAGGLIGGHGFTRAAARSIPGSAPLDVG